MMTMMMMLLMMMFMVRMVLMMVMVMMMMRGGRCWMVAMILRVSVRFPWQKPLDSFAEAS